MGSQRIAFGGIQVSTQVPLLQPPAKALLQHGVPPALQVLPFGMHIGVVDVEVVGVSVVEVVGVSVVEVVGLSHGPRRSPWRKWRSTALWETALVCSSGVPGLWQMVTFCC